MKRSFDILVSGFALLMFAAPLIVLMALVRLTSSGPSLYWSARVGKDGKTFQMPKLRTMAVNTPELPTHEFDNPEAYITGFGRFLRKSSLDEIPQLYSVLVGDMSIVGPRPMIPQYSEIVRWRQEAGVDMLRPGITGWAQVNGRDSITTEEKFALDVEYLHKRSFFFDLFIICHTFIYVFSGKGVRH